MKRWAAGELDFGGRRAGNFLLSASIASKEVRKGNERFSSASFEFLPFFLFNTLCFNKEEPGSGAGLAKR